jgi:hypothetical protein
MSTRDAERRQGLRQPVCLPVKVLFLGHRSVHPPTPDSARKAPHAVPEETPLHALAIDVSPQGFQIEVSGLAGRRFREDPEMLPRLELRFSHDELKRYGPCVGRVRWSRQDGHGGWRLGLLLDAALGDDLLQAILRAGQPREAKGRVGRDALCALIAAAGVSALWLPAYLSESSGRERAVIQQLTAEDLTDRARGDVLSCMADRAADQAARRVLVQDAGASAPGPLAAMDAASPAVDANATREVADGGGRGEELVRGMLERAFKEIDAGGARTSDDDP